MNQPLLSEVFAVSLLSIAGIGILWLYLYQLERKLNRLLERSNPQFPDLTPLFVELQQSIASEAEKSRKEATSHARNSQTAVKTLIGVMTKVQTLQDLTMTSINTGFTETWKDIEGSEQSLGTIVLNRIDDLLNDVVENTMEIVEKDGKKTRKETQEIKTRLTASRKRELLDIEEEKAAKKAKATKATSTTKKPSASK